MARSPFNQYPEPSKRLARRMSAEELGDLLRDAGFNLTKVETRVRARPEVSAEEFIQFEASSFGNFLGHLPEDLRAMARNEIKQELANEPGQENTFRAITAVATKH